MDAKDLVGMALVVAIIFAAHKLAQDGDANVSIHIENSFNHVDREKGMTRDELTVLVEYLLEKRHPAVD